MASDGDHAVQVPVVNVPRAHVPLVVVRRPVERPPTHRAHAIFEHRCAQGPRRAAQPTPPVVNKKTLE